jgi:Ca2+-binding EF-hand superfamily protein
VKGINGIFSKSESDLTAKLAFKIFDIGKDQSISENDMVALMKYCTFGKGTQTQEELQKE